MTHSRRMGAFAAAFLATAFLPVLAHAEGSNAPLVIAHRGAPAYLPEHTLAGKAMAYAQGADYLEQDIVLTKDGVPIVLHDITLDAVTDVADIFPGRAREDGKFYAIDFTLNEIKRLRVHDRQKNGKPAIAGRFPTGGATIFRIPTLQEELDLIAGLNAATGRTVGIYPEIKDPAFHRGEGQDISVIVLKALADNGYEDKDDPFFLQSFDWNEVKRIREELGFKGKLVQLIGENRWGIAPGVDFDAMKTPEGLAEVARVADGVGPWVGQLLDDADGNGTPSATPLFEAAKLKGLLVHAYTFRADQLPEWAGDFDELLGAGTVEVKLDGFFTDQPDLAVRFFLGQKP